jgi:probable rRNA maturation factor
MKKGGYNLDFVNKVKNLAASEKDFLPLLKKAVKILGTKKALARRMKGGELQMVLTSDRTIRLINKEYRGLDKPTDVVSLSYFDEPAFPGKEDLTGEIIISVDTARRQAKEHKKTLKQELQFLFVHGVLHVFGYDHEEAGERKIMFELQDNILGTKMWRKIID